MCSADIFLGLLAILFPPLPVWVKCGICSADSLINILLSILGYIPGLLHAWYVIARYPEPPYEYESLPQHQEGGRVTYVYVQAPNNHHHQQPQQQSQPKPGAQHGGMNYGTQGTSGGSAQNHSAQPQQHAGSSNAGEGSSNNHDAVPPSYADVVAGDHKVQSRD